MSYSFIANLILILSLLGILTIFFRRIPDVVDQKNAQTAAAGNGGNNDAGFSSSGYTAPAAPVEQFNNQALLKTIWDSIKEFFGLAGKKTWHFMLEAKDLKQSQIIAAKFARLVTPKARLQNIGAYNNLKKAGKLADEGKFDEAENLYIQVIRKHPQEYQAYEGMLKIYIHQKKFDESIEILNFLAEHNPDNDGYLAQLGGTLLMARKFSEAADAYRKSIAINDLVPARFVNLGLSLQGAGELEEAMTHFQRAVDLEPANVQYLLIFADGLTDLGHKDRAIIVLQKGLEGLPNHPELLSRIKVLQNPV